MKLCAFLKRSGLAVLLVLCAMMWSTVSPAVVQGEPQVNLSTNQQTYVAGDIFILSVQIQQGTQNPVVDGWVWVDIPGGGRVFLRPDLMTFSATPAPTAENLTVFDFSGPILQLPVPSFLPPGTYTISVSGAAPGLTPFDEINRFSNLASVAVALATNDDVARFAGTYSGSYSGDDHGTFRATITTNGLISGSGVSLIDGLGFIASGMVRASGAFSFATGSTSTGATFSGTISSEGEMSGTWVNPFFNESGTFHGNRQN